MKFEELKKLIVQWGNDKGITGHNHIEKQVGKFDEECIEFKEALTDYLMKDSSEEDMLLELGDVLVTIIILSEKLGIDIVTCLELAYEKISKRKGKTIDGVFFKEEDL